MASEDGSGGGGGGVTESGAGGSEGPEFFLEAHARYVKGLSARTDTLEYAVTEHLRMSGVYWGLAASTSL